MAKKCTGHAKREREVIGNYSDFDIGYGVRMHADPKWWQEQHVVHTNRAYLLRYGSMLRREARKRGLL